jgi:hypothetical protein
MYARSVDAGPRPGDDLDHGMLPHAGTDTKVWREVTALGAEPGELAEISGAPMWTVAGTCSW